MRALLLACLSVRAIALPASARDPLASLEADLVPLEAALALDAHEMERTQCKGVSGDGPQCCSKNALSHYDVKMVAKHCGGGKKCPGLEATGTDAEPKKGWNPCRGLSANTADNANRRCGEYYALVGTQGYGETVWKAHLCHDDRSLFGQDKCDLTGRWGGGEGEMCAAGTDGAEMSTGGDACRTFEGTFGKRATLEYKRPSGAKRPNQYTCLHEHLKTLCKCTENGAEVAMPKAKGADAVGWTQSDWQSNWKQTVCEQSVCNPAASIVDFGNTASKSGAMFLKLSIGESSSPFVIKSMKANEHTNFGELLLNPNQKGYGPAFPGDATADTTLIPNVRILTCAS